ncbi:hypothetical protein B0J12DRAFT_658494, partial [Macrophomina phaseolina]
MLPSPAARAKILAPERHVRALVFVVLGCGERVGGGGVKEPVVAVVVMIATAAAVRAAGLRFVEEEREGAVRRGHGGDDARGEEGDVWSGGASGSRRWGVHSLWSWLLLLLLLIFFILFYFIFLREMVSKSCVMIAQDLAPVQELTGVSVV